MNTVTLTIDGISVTVPSDYTILEAAKEASINIPTLCYLKDLNKIGACRLCLVEVAGARGLLASCITQVADGMVVKTNTAALRKARKLNLELLLSNHNRECTTCVRSQNCELQALCRELGVDEYAFDGSKNEHTVDELSPSIVRDNSKCINCRRCIAACNNMQKIGAIGATRRGFSTSIGCVFDRSLADSPCINCGQCIIACPVGALHEKSSINAVWSALNDPEKVVIVQPAPAVRASLGEEFGMPMGTAVTGKLAAALLLDGLCRLEYRGYDDAEKNDIDPRNIFTVSIMPCTAKKYESQREELGHDGLADVDAVLTVRELARMIKTAGIDFARLPDEDFDDMLGDSTGAGVIFGVTGGVMEAALRTVYEVVTGKTLDKVEFTAVRGTEGIKEAEIDLGARKIRVAVAHGTGNAKKLLGSIKSGEKSYDFIEVMGCPGGCVTGGGQPIVSAKDLMYCDPKTLRAAALYGEDSGKQLRKSHENPSLKKLYDEFLGEPCGHKSHELLHTHYEPKKKYR